MSRLSNPARGEAALAINGQDRVLRPTFSALVAVETELGSLFALVERAGDGQLRLDELATLFWHCLIDRGELTLEDVGEAILKQGLAASAKPLKTLLGQILQGGGLMPPFTAAAVRLAGLVPKVLGWVPQSFWDATPAELAAIFAADSQLVGEPLTRGELALLMERDRDG